ncbi:hypothetical protein Ahy_B02g058637 [Arachis hypogaea]|uniref:Uncharacterized protein n=1 Tax=Arachis hypogaea TaxID=3818 RepID=A0A445AF02_ARAHY|nr:hypothetical protein Ahy_B02g058637 [Arachis hypogaea]
MATDLATATCNRHRRLLQLRHCRRCLLDSTSRGAFSRFYSNEGRILNEEEQTKENVYIKISLPFPFPFPFSFSYFEAQTGERSWRNRSSKLGWKRQRWTKNASDKIFLVLLQFEDFANHNAIDLGHGHYSLATSKMLDVLLLTGTSGTCDTFGNKYLAHSPEFELKDVELERVELLLLLVICWFGYEEQLNCGCFNGFGTVVMWYFEEIDEIW